MKQALLPGTFDPPTLGHLDLIKRSEALCDKLVIGIACNGLKNEPSLFSVEEKVEMLKAITKDLHFVEIRVINGLVATFAKQNNINFLIRGVRAFSDFDYEYRMAFTNKTLSGVETVFLMASGKTSHISSSLIREIGINNSRLVEFVPSSIEEFVCKRLLKKEI